MESLLINENTVGHVIHIGLPPFDHPVISFLNAFWRVSFFGMEMSFLECQGKIVGHVVVNSRLADS